MDAVIQTQMVDRMEEILNALRDRSQNLIAAIAAYADARLAYEAALDTLEDARAKAIREGLEGRDEQARQAELLEKTRDQEDAVRRARAIYRVAEAHLEMARVAWSLEKEVLRALTALMRDL